MSSTNPVTDQHTKLRFNYFATKEQLALFKRLAWASVHKSIQDLFATFVQTGTDGMLRMVQEAKQEEDAKAQEAAMQRGAQANQTQADKGMEPQSTEVSSDSQANI